MTTTEQKTKIVARKRAMLTKNKYGRTVAQRIGETYYEAWRWNGARWQYREFNTAKEARAFIAGREVTA